MYKVKFSVNMLFRLTGLVYILANRDELLHDDLQHYEDFSTAFRLSNYMY